MPAGPFSLKHTVQRTALGYIPVKYLFSISNTAFRVIAICQFSQSSRQNRGSLMTSCDAKSL